MTRESLIRLYDFHYWARDRMLAALEPLSPEQYTREVVSSFPSIRATAVHIYAAEWIWHSRWQGVSPTEMAAAESLPDLPTLTAAWFDLEARVRQMLQDSTDADLQREIDYRLMSGQAGRSVFWHMAQHVVNHATYHRGQVVTLLRQVGAAPPAATDLIAYYREKAAPVIRLV